MVNFLLSIRSIFTFYMVNSTFNFLYGQVDLLYGQFFSIYICQCRMQTADFKGGGEEGGKEQTEGKMQTEDCRPGVKC